MTRKPILFELQTLVNRPPPVFSPRSDSELDTSAIDDNCPTDQRNASPLTNVEAIEMSRWRALAIIFTVSAITFINSMLSGLLTVGLPTIAEDLKLASHLLLWPASVNALTSGCTLLLCGSISDVIGSRPMHLLGCAFLSITTLACSLARTGIELILFRALQGIAVSFCLPSSVSSITQSFQPGSRRNKAFACLGAGQPLGFSAGLVLGGIFVDSIGWRNGYYIGAILIFLVFVITIRTLPKSLGSTSPVTKHRLTKDVDWIGAVILSSSLGLLSYIFSVMAADFTKLGHLFNTILLSLALSLVLCFVFWIRRQEMLNRIVIIPSSLWKNQVFTCLCVIVSIQWGLCLGFQYILTLFFQKVQGLTAIHTSIRFLPMVLSGVVINIGTGALVDKVSANVLLLTGAVATSCSFLLMATIKTHWSYWVCSFPAILLNPVSMDALYTISNLIITSTFPSKTHGVAGGVFNTLAQIGESVGLAIVAIISTSISNAKGHNSSETDLTLLMNGYRATFWFCLATNIIVLGIIGLGLRDIGTVG